MDQYRSLHYRITGASPLLMHNGRLADPLHEISRSMSAISSKRKKTEADHWRLAELEFKGSLYLASGTVCIPEELVEAAIVKAAGYQKRAMKARAGIVVRHPLMLEFDGPKDPTRLWEDQRFRFRCGVRISNARVMRTRPRFDSWQADLVVDFLPHVLNADEITTFLQTAGEQVGLGDWRPKYGRFYAALNSAKNRCDRLPDE